MGRFSWEICAADAIIITQFIFNNGFKNLSVEEAGAILGLTLTKAGNKKKIEGYGIEDAFKDFKSISQNFYDAADLMIVTAENLIAIESEH